MKIDIHSDEYLLGQNIRSCRIAKGWSQGKLGDAIDVDRTEISRIENGMRGEMGFKLLKKFALALGVTTDALLGTEAETPRVPDTYSLLEDKDRAMIDYLIGKMLNAAA